MFREKKKVASVAAWAAFAGLLVARSGAAVVTLDSFALSGGNTAFMYSVSGSSAEEVAPGDFFRIYDVGGLQSESAPPGFTITVANSDPTPPPNVILTNGDDPTLPNVTFTYTGAVPLPGPGTIPGFTIVSSFSMASVLKNAVTRSTLQTGLDAGTKADGINEVRVPGTIPEPASLGLLGIGAFGLLARRRRA